MNKLYQLIYFNCLSVENINDGERYNDAIDVYSDV